jgi:hypothetical protein
MTPREGVVLASRSLSLLFMVWAFSELTALPGHLYSFLRYADPVVLRPPPIIGVTTT